MPRQAACLQARCRHLPDQVAASVQQTHRSGQPPDPQPPAHESNMIITWDYDPLFSILFDNNQSLRGYYLHRAHLASTVPSKIHITLRTSKPLSRLIKASRNPLSADEILSTTVPIKVRCASEIAACSRRFISASGCALGSPGLFLLLSLGAEYSGLRVAERLPYGLGGSGEILHDDTSGSSAS